MKKIPAYVCEKCGYFELGEENAQRVSKHERILPKGICASLDGLIIENFSRENYYVFRKAPLLSHKHEALYQWELYLKQSLKPKESRLTKLLLKSLQKVASDNGSFTAEYILEEVLSATRSEKIFKNYHELSETEFQTVAEKLKKMYPQLYTNTEFKRELKHKRQSHI